MGVNPAVPAESIRNVPNFLTLSRLPLTVVLLVCIAHSWWWLGLVVFLIAAATDWLDGWWARRYGKQSAFGRAFDPLTDKILLGGAFIFFIHVPITLIVPWMVAVIIGRELLITGIRGYVESLGLKFGADWFGKLKTVLQCVTVAFALARPAFLDGMAGDSAEYVGYAYAVVLIAMMAATILSGLQYCVKAAMLLR